MYVECQQNVCININTGCVQVSTRNITLKDDILFGKMRVARINFFLLRHTQVNSTTMSQSWKLYRNHCRTDLHKFFLFYFSCCTCMSAWMIFVST